jgi:hypothetical protein
MTSFIQQSLDQRISTQWFLLFQSLELRISKQRFFYTAVTRTEDIKTMVSFIQQSLEQRI